MPTGYQIEDQAGCYYLTFQVIDWIDIFTRNNYCKVILDSFEYCRQNKGLQLWAYVIMTNHVHVIVSAKNENLSDVVRDFKRHTATTILKMIDDKKESRRTWMLNLFEFAAKRHKRSSKYQFWTHENHAVSLESELFLRQKMSYLHLNPVRAGFVDHPNHWMYSSQRNYFELDSLIDIDLMDI